MSSGPWLGVIADDLTGATDAAAFISRSGHETIQFAGVPLTARAELTNAAAVVVALRTRTAPAAQAVTQALRAAEWLTSLGVDHIHFKYCSTFDSTGAGNIGPVADALADRLGVDQVLVVPSAPENGRTVHHSQLFVHDELLHHSPMRYHPLTPMTESDLRLLMGAQSANPVVAIGLGTVHDGEDAIERKLAATSGRHSVIGDAVSGADLDRWAGVALRRGFSTGSAGLVGAIAARRRGAATASPATVPRGPTAILAGSCSAATRGQVAGYLAAQPGWELDVPALLPGGGALGAAEAFLTEQLAARRSPLVYSTARPDRLADVQSTLGVAVSAGLVEDAMGHLARHAVDLGVKRLIVAGGETSGAVVAALGASAVRFGPEVAPGVPWTVTLTGEPIALLLKSGNFGSVAFFEEAVAWA